jgi:hypothetical protein
MIMIMVMIMIVIVIMIMIMIMIIGMKGTYRLLNTLAFMHYLVLVEFQRVKSAPKPVRHLS